MPPLSFPFSACSSRGEKNRKEEGDESKHSHAQKDAGFRAGVNTLLRKETNSEGKRENRKCNTKKAL